MHEHEQHVHDTIAKAQGKTSQGRNVRRSVVEAGLTAVLDNVEKATDLEGAKAAARDFKSRLGTFLDSCK